MPARTAGSVRTLRPPVGTSHHSDPLPDRQQRRCRRSVPLLAILLVALVAPPAAAEPDEPPPPGRRAGATILNKPDAQVPLDLQFSDESGPTVKLGDYFQPDRPVLLDHGLLRLPAACAACR